MENLARAQKEVMANVGRNIVMFQALEATMKHLVPLFSAVGTVSSEGRAKRYAKAQTKTLGQLVGELLEKANFDNPQFATHYGGLVEQRNALVHHFGEAYGKGLETEEGCGSIVARLKAQYEQIKEMRNSLHGLLSGMLVCICQIQFAGTDEYAEMRAMCEQLLEQIDPKYLPELAIVPAETNLGTNA